MRVFAPVVWLALLQIFVVSLLAVSPDLHEYFHPDSHDSDHHCLSTDFQAGFIEQPVIVPVVAPDFAPVALPAASVSAEVRHFLPLHLCGSLLEHGPPSLA